jgi:hypothetical protein
MITTGSVSGLSVGLYIQTVTGAGSRNLLSENKKDCFPFFGMMDCAERDRAEIDNEKNNIPHRAFVVMYCELFN